ncbi:uncharacterized protein LOC141613719 [Silene latifolia]|uniref:uncharacterized protein LOC141613719 n=1 Tax=Silene latifolia TaxID=37657 RepID=UPI003D77FEAE
MILFKQAYHNNHWLNSSLEYTVKAGYEWLRVPNPKVEWRFLCWNTLNISRCSFVFWEFLLQRLPTRDRLSRRGMPIDPTCPICLSLAENHQHLFHECPFAVLCHQRLQVALNVHFRMPDLITWFSAARRITKFQKRYIGSCYVALVYWIWRCRNEAWINNRVRSPGSVVKQILADVRARFLALNVTTLKDKDRVWLDTL